MEAAGIDVIRLNLGTAGRARRTDPAPARGRRAQVRYLASRGHRRLGYAYPDDPRVEGFASPDWRARERACEQLGLPPIDVQTIPLDGLRPPAASSLGSTGAADISAVVAYNDASPSPSSPPCESTWPGVRLRRCHRCRQRSGRCACCSALTTIDLGTLRPPTIWPVSSSWPRGGDQRRATRRLPSRAQVVRESA